MTCDCCNKGEENAGIILRALAFIKDEKARLNKSAQIQESYLVGYEKKTWFDKENSRAIAKDAMHKRDLVKSLREIENILLGGELE